MQTIHSDEEKAKVWTLISDAPTAVLATLGPEGIRSRPMACIERDFDGALWFMTSRQSHKLDEISRNPDVLVSYADPRATEFVAVLRGRDPSSNMPSSPGGAKRNGFGSPAVPPTRISL